MLTILLFTLLVNTTFGQELPQGLKMHRALAGDPDSTGWMLAKSTEGGFSVRLPLKFNDFTFTESDPKSPTLRVFTVGTKSQEGIKFSATRIVYRQGIEDAKLFFNKFEKGQELGIKPERISPHRLGERRAVDLVFKRGENIAYERIVLLDKDLLLMIIESPASYDMSVQQFAQTFFDSLVVVTN